MSLTRSIFNEFRPLFRMMEDPFSFHTPSISAVSRRAFADPFFQWQTQTPALNLSEEEGTYVVEAELPGVKKENVDVRIGDNGRSLIIEGRILNRGTPAATEASTSTDTPAVDASTATPAASATPAEAPKDTTTTAVAAKGRHHQPDSLPHSLDISGNDTVTNILSLDSDNQNQVASYPPFRGSRTFTRTVWLPYPINPSEVKARLEDGILTVRAPKAAQESVNVAVE